MSTRTYIVERHQSVAQSVSTLLINALQVESTHSQCLDLHLALARFESSRGRVFLSFLGAVKGILILDGDIGIACVGLFAYFVPN